MHSFFKQVFYLLFFLLASSASALDLSGRVFTDQGSTSIGVGKTVSVSVNGGAVAASDDTDGSGDYSITGVTAGAGDVLTLFIDGETERGVRVTVTDGSNLTGADIYQDYLIVDNDNGGSTTNTNLALADNSADADISSIFTESSGNITTTNIYVAGSYAPGGQLTTGNFYADAYVNTSTDIFVSGNWTNNTGSALDLFHVSFTGAAVQINDPHSTFGGNLYFSGSAKVVDIVGYINTNRYQTVYFFTNVTLNSGTIKVAKDLRIASGRTLDGSGLLEFVTDFYGKFFNIGTVDIEILINCSSAENTVSFRGLNMATKSVTVREGRLWTEGYNLSVGGGIVVEDGGKFRSTSQESFTVPTFQAGSAFEYINETTSDLTLPSSITSFTNLLILGTSTGDFTLPNTDITVSESLTVSGIELNYSAAGNVQANGLVVEAGAQLVNTGTGDLTLGGDVVNDGFINFNTSGGGGTHSDNILIRSTVGGVQRNWQGSGSFWFADVDYQDMTAIGGSPSAIYVGGGTDSGNNVNWDPGITVSGIVYAADRTTPLGAGLTVSLAINNGAVAASADTDASGRYVLPAAGVSGASDRVTLFLDDETENGATVIIVNSKHLDDIDIYQDHVISNRKSSSGISTNGLFQSLQSSGDSDLAVLAPGGVTITAPNGLVIINSLTGSGYTLATTDLEIVSGTYTADSVINVSGSWINSGGTVDTASVNTVVNFTATSGTETITEPGSFYDVSFNDAGGSATWQLGSSLTVSNDLTITDGILDTNDPSDFSVAVGHDLTQSGGQLQANDSTITVAGDVAADGSEDNTQLGLATFVLTGTGSFDYSGSSVGVYNLISGQSGEVTTLSNAFWVYNVLTVGSGQVRGIHGGTNVNLSGTAPLSLDANATVGPFQLTFYGSATVPNLPGGYDCSMYLGGDGTVVTQSGDVVLNTEGLFLLAGGVPNWDLGWDTNGFDLSIAGNVTVGTPSSTDTKYLDISGSTLTVGGDLNIAALTTGSAANELRATNSTIILNSSSAQTIVSSGSVLSSVIVNNSHASDQVSFLDNLTISESLDIQDGQVVFGAADLTVSDISANGTALTVASGASLTNAGTGNLTLGGNVSNAGTISFDSSGSGAGDADSIQIRSTSNGTQRNWQGAGTFTMIDVDVEDQEATGGTPATILAQNSTDTGNNTNWTFDSVIGGYVSSDNGGTPIGAGYTISVSVNGGSVARSAVTDAGGNYLISGVLLSPGDILVAFIDDDVSQSGLVMTESDGNSITDLNIRGGGDFILRNDNGGVITNADFALADNSGDTDITGFYSVSGSEVTVLTGNQFVIAGPWTPGGDVVSESIDLRPGGILSMEANALEVKNGFGVNGGSFVAGTGTVTFTFPNIGTSISSSSLFYNVVINGGVTSRFSMSSNIAVLNDLTIISGILDTVDANDFDLTVGRDLIMTGGQLQANDSTITVGRNANFDGVGDSSQLNNARLTLAGTGALSYNNLASSWSNGFFNLDAGQAGNTTTLNNDIGVLGTLSIGTGSLVSSSSITFRGANPISVVSSSVLDLDFCTFRDNTFNLPEIQTGYNCNLRAASGAVSINQTGDVDVTGGFNYLFFIPSGGGTWSTNGFDLTVVGNIVLGPNNSSNAVTLDVTNSSVEADIVDIRDIGTGSVQSNIISTNSTITLGSNFNESMSLRGSELNNVVINSGASNTFTLSDEFMINGTLDIQGGQIIYGLGDLAISDAAASGSALTVASGASLTNTGTGNLTLGGDVSNAGTISFDSSDDAGNGLLIISTSVGVQRDWSGAGTYSFEDVSVRDMTTPGTINVASGTNLGGNANWIFDGAVLSAASALLDDNTATLGSNITFGFTTSNSLLAAGKIAITFPAGFDISGITGATSSDISGTFVVESISGQELVLSRVAGSDFSGTVSDLVVTGLINPPTAGVTGAFGLETRDAVDSSIDTGGAAGVSIDPNTFVLAGVVRDSGGLPLVGVAVSGGVLGNTVTDSAGAFSFGAVTAGTSYSISYNLVNYSFSPSSGTLSFDASLSVVGFLTGQTVSGFVTQSNQDRTPIAGATVTDGVSSATSAADGSYTLSGVALNSTVYAEYAGYKFEEPNSGLDQVALDQLAEDSRVDFVGTPSRSRITFAAWNTFLDMTAILELSNTSSSAQFFTVTLFDAVGSTVSSMGIELQPLEKKDIILNDILARPEEYGVVKVEALTTSYLGRVMQYRLDEFSYGVELSGGIQDESNVSYNSYQPSLAPEDQASSISNWLSVVNLSEVVQGYQIIRYGSDGSLQRDDVYFVAPKGRLDIQGGHETGQQAGHHSIVPLDPSAKYLAFLTRYSEIDGGLSGYHNATNLTAQQPQSLRQYLTVSNLNSGSTWLEITNASDYLEEVSLEVVSAEGVQVHIETFGLVARAQRHFNVSSVLPGLGYVRISTRSGQQVMVDSLTYFSEISGAVAALKSVPGKDVFGDERSGRVNTFFDSGNWLTLINISENFQQVVVESNGVSKTYDLGPNKSILVPLFSSAALDFPADAYGEVQVVASDYGAILSEISFAGGVFRADEPPKFSSGFLSE